MRLCRGHSFQAGAFALSFIFLCKCVNTLRQVLSEAKKKKAFECLPQLLLSLAHCSHRKDGIGLCSISGFVLLY
jgi:hypothetical protein